MMSLNSTVRLFSRQQLQLYSVTSIEAFGCRAIISAVQIRGTSSIKKQRYIYTTSESSTDNEEELRLKIARLVREYRKENYRQTLFSRFLKEIIKYTDTNNDGQLSLDKVKLILANIGMDEKYMPSSELKQVWKGISKEASDVVYGGGGSGGSGGSGGDLVVPVDYFIKFATMYHKKLNDEEKLG